MYSIKFMSPLHQGPRILVGEWKSILELANMPETAKVKFQVTSLDTGTRLHQGDTPVGGFEFWENLSSSTDSSVRSRRDALLDVHNQEPHSKE